MAGEQRDTDGSVTVEGTTEEYLRYLVEAVHGLDERVTALEERCVTHDEMMGLTETVATVGHLLAGVKDRMTNEPDDAY